MKYFLLFLAGLTLLWACNSNKNLNKNQMEPYNFTKSWEKISSLEEQGLLKSANIVAEEIYREAKARKIINEQIKALFYRAKYISGIEEDGFLQALQLFEREMATAQQPEKSLLQSVLAELYDSYLMQNLWKINERKAPLTSDDPDIRNWAAQQFADRSATLYLASLADPGVYKVPLSDLGELILPGTKSPVDKSNLYELLAYRAIQYFKEDKYFLSRAAQSYTLKDPALFGPAAVYSTIDFSQYPESREKQVLLLMQDLTKKYLDAGEKEKLADIEIQRLVIVKSYYKGIDGESQFLSSLDRITREYSGLKESAEAWYYIASNMVYGQQSFSTDNREASERIRQAHDICKSTIDKYPGSYGADLCKGLLTQIESKTLSIITEQVNLPEENIICLVSYKNIPEIFLKIVAFDRKAYEKSESLKQRDIHSFVKNLPVIRTWDQLLPGGTDFLDHQVELSIGKLPKGSYALIVSDNADFSNVKSALEMATFFVSNLAYWQSEMEKSSYIYVTDRTTGAPKPNVRVDFFNQYYDGRQAVRQNLNSLRTNKDGYVILEDTKNQRNLTIELSDEAGDDLYIRENIYPGFKNIQPISSKHVLFFMDRTLYRPGQTAYFKGILYEKSSEKPPAILPGVKNIEITLYDANYQKVGSSVVVSNEFGSFSGHFVLPSSGLPGTFNLASNQSHERVYFNVEEYKRPTFTVGIDPYEKDYKLGDTLLITGAVNKFAGIPLSSAAIKYRFSRKPYFPYWSYYSFRRPFYGASVEIASGTLTADQEGKFSIPVHLLKDDLIPSGAYPNYRFELEVDATDLTGETHSAKSTVIAGTISKNVELILPEKQEASKPLKLEIQAKNLSGAEQDISGRIKVTALEKSQKIYRQRFWGTPDMWLYSKEEFRKLFPYYAYREEDKMESAPELEIVFDGVYNSLVSKNMEVPLKKGHYKIEFSFLGDDAQPVTITKFTEIFEGTDVPGDEPVFLMVKGGEPGENAMISIQSKIPGQAVIFEVLEKKLLGIHRWEMINGSRQIIYPITEKHRGDFFTRIVYVYNNRVYSATGTIAVPWTNKELEIEYLSFRSRLLPGQDEQWILKVKGSKKDQVLAEMLATMYDASLDDIKKHQWWANIYSNNYLSYSPRFFGFGASRTRSYTDYLWNDLYYPTLQNTFHTLNWFGMEPYSYQIRFDADVYTVRRDGKVLMNAPLPPPAAESGAIEEASQNDLNASAEKVTEDQTVSEPDVPPARPAEVQIRTNLNETVFFYPHLKTDSEGNVIISFTMNEALTAWRFMAIAHTKDFALKITENQVVTAKDFMIMPNVPRFLRVGDEFQLRTLVSNQADKLLRGEVELRLFDAATNQDITQTLVKDQIVKTFDIDQKGLISKNWTLMVSESTPGLLRYRIVGKSGVTGDGEEGLIPVFSNKQLVTETMPMYFNGNSKKTYEFDALRKSLKSDAEGYKLTVEFTSHPIWYAIQALPFIKVDGEANSIQLANTLYSNMLGREVIRQNPSIKRVFDKWSALPVEKQTLSSQLEKNQELKNVLLEETPWVLDAQDEAEQKRNIGLLMNLNQMQQDQNQIIQRLKALQGYDGGFSWYSGGRSSEYLSLYVLETLGKLKNAGIMLSNTPEISDMITKTMAYVDARFIENYEDLLASSKKNNLDLTRDHLSTMAVYYLYVRSFFKEVEKNDKTRDASLYYLDQAEKYWLKRGVYSEGMIALVLYRYGNSTKAKSILASLEERSIFSDELGRYWKQNPGYHWYELPVETQALMVEAFDEIRKNDPIIDQMKVWLIKNKQTNRWKTPKASVAAIHALLLGQEKLLSEQKILQVKLGKNNLTSQLKPEDTEAGTGYFKLSWDAEKVHSDMSAIEVDNPNRSVAWGAAYWQYFQQLHKIEKNAASPLKISRQMQRVVDTKSGERLENIDANSILKPGDKLMVSLRIETDRPMDFIHIKDQRSSALEPLVQTSGYEWKHGLSYYISSGDAATNFYVEYLPKGVYIIQYPLRATHSGNFSNGIATIQCYYAPEFSGHSEGVMIKIQGND